MKIRRGDRGQTLVETAFILLILFGILFAITEFARAWYVKNSLKNSARQGARVAVVRVSTTITPSSFSCENGMTCPYTADAATIGPIKNAVCCQPGVPKKPDPASTDVTLTCTNSGGSTIACNSIINGEQVQVRVVYDDPNFFVIGGGIWPWPKALNTTAEATMCYE